LAQHVGNYKCYLNGKSNYVSSFEILQNRNYDIVLIEIYPCNSKDELHARERYHTNNIECINQYKNQGMYNELGKLEYQKQYHEKNKDIKNERSKEYYNDNKDKQNEKHNCVCGGKYTHINKQSHEETKNIYII